MHHGELCLYPVLKLVLHVVSCFANDVCFLVGSELSNNLCNLVCWNERNVREAGVRVCVWIPCREVSNFPQYNV